MPTLVIYTNINRPGKASVPSYVIGDSTTNWRVRFINENQQAWNPTGVSLRVGHVNGLVDGTYMDAFKWIDRAGNEHEGSITVTSGIPSLAFGVTPTGGVVGSNGVYLLRGEIMRGQVTGVDVISSGGAYTPPQSAQIGTQANDSYAGYYDEEDFVDTTSYYESLPGKNFSGYANMVLDPANCPGGATALGQVDRAWASYWKSNLDAASRTMTYGHDAAGALTNASYAVLGPMPFATAFAVNGALTITNRGSNNFYDGGINAIENVVYSSSNSFSIGLVGEFYVARAKVSSFTVTSAGEGYTEDFPVLLNRHPKLVSLAGISATPAVLIARVAAPKYAIPFKREEANNQILAALSLTRATEGRRDAAGVRQYDHSRLVIRPRVVAEATLALDGAGPDWVGSLDPVNAYTNARLARSGSTDLDLQVFGDGRMLFQGALPVLNKIA